MAHEPFVCVLVIRCDAALIHPFLYDVEYLFVLRHPKPAVLNRDDIVASRCIKACHYIAIPVISHRKLCLVAVAVWIVCANRRLHFTVQLCLGKSTYTHEIVAHLIIFKFKLLFIRERLYLAAATPLVQLALRLNAKSGRGLNLFHSCVAIVFL